MGIGWLFAMFPSVNELCIIWSGVRLIEYKGATSRICPNLTVPSNYECILPKNRSLFPKSTFSAKTKIKIKYDLTKMIPINSKAKIDLNDSKIILDYSSWYR
jgi:hypothetical protein